MKQKIKQKKRYFRYCTALLATMLLVGSNCFITLASETENAAVESNPYEADNDNTGQTDGENTEEEESIPAISNDSEESETAAKENDSITENQTVVDENPSVDGSENNTAPVDKTPADADNNTDPIEAETIETSVTEDEDNVAADTDKEENTTENSNICICAIRCNDSDQNQNCPICAEDFTNCTANIIVDKIEIPIRENVAWICNTIDAFPTAAQLYANKPDAHSENYAAWLSETKEILLQISELQEQYRLLSAEERTIVGAVRKEKLDALEKMAAELLEDSVVYAEGDSASENNSPLRYEIIKETDNANEVKVISGTNYGTSLSGTISIPTSINYKNKDYKVTEIDKRAFAECENIANIVIPDSINTIGQEAFRDCTKLSSVTLSNNTTINNGAFNGCSQLSTMIILVKNENTIRTNQVTGNVFGNSPEDPTYPTDLNRNIVFKTVDGTELSNTTTPRLVTAVNAYKAVNDGNTNDYLWYGWNLKVPTFAVTPNVFKDTIAWSDHNRTFALKTANSEDLITDLTSVENGTYSIIDITNNLNIDTGASVTINDDDSSNSQPINYYTVTFYDPDNPYDESAPQKPQIILKDQTATEPPDPTKEGFTFDGWKTAKENGQAFDFSNSTINAATNIYASWIDDGKANHQVTIKVQLDNQEWSNSGKTFQLQSSDNTLINPNEAPNGTYTIIDTTNGELDTGIPVTVHDGNAEATVNYYTITFYNDNAVHISQIVLKDQKAEVPPEPTKEGFTFVKWKTSPDGDTEFDFNTLITQKTDVYADWSTETYYTITPSKEGNGTISPSTATKVVSGGEITFTFTPDNGYHIKEVLIDDNNVTSSLSGNTYTFTNVTQDHTIKVIFEEDTPGDDDNKPGDDTPGDDDNKPGDDTPGDDDNNPGDDTPGNDDNKPGEDTPGDDDNKPGDDTPGDDDNKPGDNTPGDDDNKPGDNTPDDDDNKPGDNTPGDDDNKPGDNTPGGNDKPSGSKPDNGDKPNSGESSSGNTNSDNNSSSSNTPTSINNNSTSTQTAADMPQSAIGVMPNDIYPNLTVPNGILDSANSIVSANGSTVLTDGNLPHSVKDAEPQTGDTSNTGVYAAIAIAAGLVLLLLHLLEWKNTIPTKKPKQRHINMQQFLFMVLSKYGDQIKDFSLHNNTNGKTLKPYRTLILQTCLLYCRPPGFTVMFPGKYLAGGLQSDCTVKLTGAQYQFQALVHQLTAT